ncbi:hypothetical protein QOT17_010462 [Balamuthia mandrillaris]
MHKEVILTGGSTARPSFGCWGQRLLAVVPPVLRNSTAGDPVSEKTKAREETHEVSVRLGANGLENPLHGVATLRRILPEGVEDCQGYHYGGLVRTLMKIVAKAVASVPGLTCVEHTFVIGSDVLTLIQPLGQGKTKPK